MVMTKFFIGAAALSAPLVAGHGYMGLPKVSFPKGGDITAPAGTIASSQFKAPAGMSFTTDPESNTKAFTAWIKTSEYKSLKDLIVKKGGVGECGNSAVADPQPLPDQVEWTHGASEGFTASHQGPCEVWCDDKMAFHDDNCAKNYPAAPAKLPYDKSMCAGAKKLATYWLALHSPDWQMYVGCAALSGASAGGSSSSGGGASPTPASKTPVVKPTTKPSSPSTPASPPAPAPAAGGNTGGDEDCDEEYPEPADNAAGDEDCDEDLPEPAAGGADEDCDEEYPEPSDTAAGDADVGKDADCDEEYPEPADDCDDDLPEPDCDDDLPEPRSAVDEDEDVQTSNINFNTYNDNVGEDAPGKVTTQEY